MISVSLEVCAAHLLPLGQCPECGEDDCSELVATGPGGWTPARPGRRSGYDRFPEPDEPGEWDGDCTLVLHPGGTAVVWDDLPAETAGMLTDGMIYAAEDSFLSALDEAAADRADYDRDVARDRALEGE